MRTTDARARGRRINNTAFPPAAILSFLIVLNPQSAVADIGLPMLAIVWPVSWLLLIPIVLIESIVATRVTHQATKKCFLAATLANCFSTFVGIPLTWVVLVMLEIVVSLFGPGGISTTFSKLFAVTIQAPWLVPYRDNADWMIPCASTVLLLPLFLSSVAIEAKVFRHYLKCEPIVAKKWSWVSNGITYAILAAVSLALSLHALLQHRW